MNKKKHGKRSKKRQQARERAQTQGAKEDMRRKSTDAAWGTSSASLGQVKRESAEAKMDTCFECGYSGGRHASMCSRA